MDQASLNQVADEIIAAAGKLKAAGSPASPDEKKLESLRERENKWHRVSMDQLSFYNNLLIILGTGFLAFVIKEFIAKDIYFTWSNINWQLTLVVWSVIIMTASTLCGLCCGFNRLVDFRYTHKANKLRRKLYENNIKEYGEGKWSSPLNASLYYWFKDAPFFKVENSDFTDKPDEVKKKINGCSKLADQLGRTTRIFLRFQAGLFALSMITFVISFIQPVLAVIIS